MTTPTATCAFCSCQLTKENDSNEHVIPNAIGGRRKVKGFICRSCNNSVGNDWDSELAKQYHWLSLYSGIKRERGEVPSKTIKTALGDELKLLPNRSMIPNKIAFENNNGNIRCTVGTNEQLNTIIKQLLKNYSFLNKEDILNKTVKSEHPLDSAIREELKFGGPLAGRSYVKTAIAFASSLGLLSIVDQSTIAYLTNNIDESPPFAFFYLRDLVLNRPEDNIFHCVTIYGDPVSKRLVGYIEYFGLSRVVVRLNDSYTGDEIKSVYAIDPVSGKDAHIIVDLKLTDEEYLAVKNNTSMPLAEYEQAANKSMKIISSIAFNHDVSIEIEKAFVFAFEHLGYKQNDVLKPEHVNEFSRIFTEQVMPFLMRYMDHTNSFFPMDTKQ